MAIDVNDLRRVQRDENQNNLYDLFIQSHRADSTITIRYYIVDQRYQMRLDRFVSDIYGDIRNLGLIMKINNILNPFSLKTDDIIYYIDPETVKNLEYIDPKILDQQLDQLVNSLKNRSGNLARNQYLKDRNQPIGLPPTVKPATTSKSIIDNGKIVLAPNLFANPNASQLGSDATTNSNNSNNLSGGNNLGSNTNVDDVSSNRIGDNVGSKTVTIRDSGDTTERVLVDRFIRSGNTIIDLDEEENDN
jgi:hypothetical protein